MAVAALLQLWDRQLSFAGHAQLMAVMTEHLDCLQVGPSNAMTTYMYCHGLIHSAQTCRLHAANSAAIFVFV